MVDESEDSDEENSSKSEKEALEKSVVADTPDEDPRVDGSEESEEDE